MKNGLWAEEVDEPTAQRVADIVGTSSAAGRALRQLAERRLAGEDVVLLKSGRMFFVAPRTQVCDAVRSAAPGLPFAAVDRVAAAVMKLYGR